MQFRSIFFMNLLIQKSSIPIQGHFVCMFSLNAAVSQWFAYQDELSGWTNSAESVLETINSFTPVSHSGSLVSPAPLAYGAVYRAARWMNWVLTHPRLAVRVAEWGLDCAETPHRSVKDSGEGKGKKSTEQEFGSYVGMQLSGVGQTPLPFPLSNSASWTMNEQQQVIVVLVLLMHCLLVGWLFGTVPAQALTGTFVESNKSHKNDRRIPVPIFSTLLKNKRLGGKWFIFQRKKQKIIICLNDLCAPTACCCY